MTASVARSRLIACSTSRRTWLRAAAMRASWARAWVSAWRTRCLRLRSRRAAGWSRSLRRRRLRVREAARAEL